MTTVSRTHIARPGTAALVVALFGGLAGCAPPAAPPPTAPAPTAPAGTGPVCTGSAGAGLNDADTAATCAAAGPAASADRALPAGAIAVGPDLYQVPIGPDAEGCQMYRLHSPGRMVTQAIAWRRPDGSFTLDRREAACAS